MLMFHDNLLLFTTLQDQQFALQWVKNNIENFGGDSSEVTLSGISSGGISVAIHIMNMEEQSQLFNKVQDKYMVYL